MSLSLFARKAVAFGVLATAIPGMVLAEGNYSPHGNQYAIAGRLAGEQVRPRLTVGNNGGFLVWEDNITDGFGLGISAVRLDNNLAAAFAPFRVNSGITNDQERPQATLLNGGGAAFVWQSGLQGFQHIYARFMTPSNTWASGDVLVNAATDRAQVGPEVACLANGNVVIVYSSFNQVGANSLQDVYAQIVSPNGQKVGGEFQVNQFTAFNQRSACVTPLQGGGFVVVWISEQQRSGSIDVISPEYLYNPTNRPSVDVFARMFNASGAPMGSEFLVNSSYDVCGNPRVARGTDGGFMVTWSQKTYGLQVNGWDIVARPFSSAGVGGNEVPVNSYLYGDQFAPQISSSGTDYFILWTSLAQDGSREGVFGRVIRSSGAVAGIEVRANTTTVGQQMHPAVASDREGSFLTVWTSFVGGEGSFDLYAQRWVDTAQPLMTMAAPFVYAPFVIGSGSGAYEPQLQVSWAPLSGIAVDHYEVYVNGATTPRATVATNFWLMTAADGLAANSASSFQVAFVAPDGRRSPLSPPTVGRTWSGFNWEGIPWEWMSAHYGSNIRSWPSAESDLANGGPTLLQVFLSGANPLDPGTWLRTTIERRPEGYFLTWNPQPGMTYQVQTGSSLSSWSNVGQPRFAAGVADSVYIGGSNSGFYRVLRLR